MIRAALIALACGLMFGAGLAISGMTNPARVIGFLDVFGAFDPTLAFVMLGALAPMSVAWRLKARLERPLAAQKFSVPTATVLMSWAVEVRPGLVFAGVDDLTARRQYGLDSAPVKRALEGRPAGATVFLSHTPWKAEEAARLGAGLMLSGHTHAGQIWPFGHLAAIQYPLLEGRYEVGGMTVLVCRGTGTWGPRMRLFGPSEILLVTLRAG
jgi:predicted MPP superfamily phosphohydrolase